MQIITLLNEKGGVGKTSLATHIATGLAIKGYRVILVDADPQGHATISLGLKKEPMLYQTLIYDLAFDEAIRPINPNIFSSDAHPAKGSLYIIPTDASARVIPMMTSDTHVVLKKFRQLENYVDYVVFDTAPTPSLLHGSIYIATDSIIYPTECAFLSFDGLAESIGRREQVRSDRSELQLGDIKVAGIVPNKVRRHKDGYLRSHQHALEMLHQQFGNIVWPPIDLNTTWEQAQFAQRVLFNYAPDSRATQQIWKIVNKVVEVA